MNRRIVLTSGQLLIPPTAPSNPPPTSPPGVVSLPKKIATNSPASKSSGAGASNQARTPLLISRVLYIVSLGMSRLCAGGWGVLDSFRGRLGVSRVIRMCFLWGGFWGGFGLCIIYVMELVVGCW